MMGQEIIGSWTANCLRHKREKITHVCIENKCYNNALLCPQCFNENVNLSYHYDHESSILGIAQAIDRIGSTIKMSIPSVNKVFKSTLARGEHLNLLQQIQKGGYIYEQLEQRINTIKTQVDLELDLLIKEFQKVMLIEKQEYFKLLDTYQRSYTKNMEYIRTTVQPLLDFQTSTRYYANQNNLYMKILSEARKKTDWFSKTKKSLHHLGKIIESGSSYNSDLNTLLASASRIKLDIWPAWKGEESIDKTNDLKYIIKRSMNQWAYIPELKILNQSAPYEGISPNGNISNIQKNYYSANGAK